MSRVNFTEKASVIRDLCVRRVLPPEIYVTHENLKISLKYCA